MACNDVETALALESLRAPLELEPLTSQEHYINDMRARYRCYFVEYDVNQGAAVMPKMFSDDFGHELGQIATLVDSNDNRFQCLVEKMNANVYLTRGWTALRDFYNIRIGAWVVLIYAGSSEFGLIVQDRFLKVIPPPLFVPPMRFMVDMTTIPSYFINNVPGAMQNRSCRHDPHYLHLCHDKKLTYYDISTGFLMLPYDGFGQYAFDEITTSLKMVDDCGSAWNCDLIYVTFPFKHYRIGGEWSRIVAARRLTVGRSIRCSAQAIGHSQTLYVMLRI
ncbi:hypothetical protein QL285_043896 [Trifolium repens]|nr:hypothetical protein QL285_043896 [Trifolium repens]